MSENGNIKLKNALSSFSNSVSDKMSLARESTAKLGLLDKFFSKYITNWLFKKKLIEETEKDGINDEISEIMRTVKVEIDSSESAKSILGIVLPALFEYINKNKDNEESEKELEQ